MPPQMQYDHDSYAEKLRGKGGKLNKRDIFQAINDQNGHKCRRQIGAQISDASRQFLRIAENQKGQPAG